MKGFAMGNEKPISLGRKWCLEMMRAYQRGLSPKPTLSPPSPDAFSMPLEARSGEAVSIPAGRGEPVKWL